MRPLLICGSIKPPAGSTTPSAARELLRVVAKEMRQVGAETDWLDLRDLRLPLFDGRRQEEYGSEDLERLAATIHAADLVVLSCPAYWSAPSGVLKNCLDLLGGPDYRRDEAAQSAGPGCFAGSVVVLLVVGADDAAAQNAQTSLRATLAHLGAWVAPTAFTVGNLRQVADRKVFMASLAQFAREVVALCERTPVG
jgi:NAD(P)H-dependent FMN reductase